MKKPSGAPVIFTIGHSTRGLEELVRSLRTFGVRRLVDVRTIPRSRHNPQFNRETLGVFLRNRRICYRHMKSLGGLRHPLKGSINTAWRTPGFRGFADYMQTPQFEEALGKLITLSSDRPTAIMCAEAVPWRCHRSLISDALSVRGVRVVHIMGATSSRMHEITAMAKVKGGKVTYPG